MSDIRQPRPRGHLHFTNAAEPKRPTPPPCREYRSGCAIAFFLITCAPPAVTAAVLIIKAVA